MSDLKNKVDFSIIRYANCWEDPFILLEALDIKQGEKVLSIASAGDNSFSLLMNDPEIVVAVDLNRVQLFLAELKIVAIKNFSREEYLKFVGFNACDKRKQMLLSITNGLSPAAREYWANHAGIIEQGVIHGGKFEKYFQYFSNKILPWVHNKSEITELMRIKSSDEQTDFYNKKWNTWRWKLFFKLFFSKYVMGKYGRDPEFLKEVKVPVSEFIFRKAEEHLSTSFSQDNFILHYNLLGEFGTKLPHYVLAGNYEKIKSNIGRIKLFEGYAQEAAREFGHFDKMNLSNIFEYMDKNTFENAGNAITEILNPGGRLAYWNLMVPRRISKFHDQLNYLEEFSENLKERDKGFFYNKFVVEEKHF